MPYRVYTSIMNPNADGLRENDVCEVLYIGQDSEFECLVRHEVSSMLGMRYIGYTGCICITDVRSNIGATRPAIILLDAQSLDTDVRTGVGTMVEVFPHSSIVMLATYASDVAIYEASRPGIAGLIWKTPFAAEQLRAAIRDINAGRPYFDLGYEEARIALWRKPDAYFKIFSQSEQALLPLFGRGQTDTQIALILKLAVCSIQTFRHRIICRLGLHRTIDLMQWAEATGFVTPRLPAPPCEWDDRVALFEAVNSRARESL